MHVFSDTNEFLGQTYFEYEDVLKKAVFQAVQYGPDAVSELFARMGKYTCDLSSNQSSSAKKNSGEFDWIWLNYVTQIINIHYWHFKGYDFHNEETTPHFDLLNDLKQWRSPTNNTRIRLF